MVLKNPVGKKSGEKKPVDAKPPKEPKPAQAPKPAREKKPFGRRIAAGMQTVEEWLVEHLTKTPMTKMEAGAAINKYYGAANVSEMTSHQHTIDQYLTDAKNVAYFGGKLDKKYNLFCHKTGEDKETKYYFKPITEEERKQNAQFLANFKVKQATKKAKHKELVQEVVAEQAAKDAAKVAPAEAPSTSPATSPATVPAKA